jgi:hypothetical protein
VLLQCVQEFKFYLGALVKGISRFILLTRNSSAKCKPCGFARCVAENTSVLPQSCSRDLSSSFRDGPWPVELWLWAWYALIADRWPNAVFHRQIQDQYHRVLRFYFSRPHTKHLPQAFDTVTNRQHWAKPGCFEEALKHLKMLAGRVSDDRGHKHRAVLELGTGQHPLPLP